MSAHDAVQMPRRDPLPTGNRFGLTEALVAAERLLIKARHQPASLLATVGVPVAMILIFGFIFGSAITVPGGTDYREYLIPGLFVFGAANLMSPMVTMAQDRQRGFVDRLRSMPITRAGIPAGQATATAIYGLWSLSSWPCAGSPLAGASTPGRSTQYWHSHYSWLSSSR